MRNTPNQDRKNDRRILERHLRVYEHLIAAKDAHITDLQGMLEHERQRADRLQMSLTVSSGPQRKTEDPKPQDWLKWLKPETGMSGWQVALFSSIFASGLFSFVFSHYIAPSIKFLHNVPAPAVFAVPFTILQFALMFLYVRSAKRGDDITSEAIYSWAELSMWVISSIFLIRFPNQIANEDPIGLFLNLVIVLFLTPYSVTKIGYRIRSGKWPPTTITGGYGCLAVFLSIGLVGGLSLWISH